MTARHFALRSSNIPEDFFAENWRTKRRELVTGNSDYTGKTSADMNGVIDDGRNV